jgi:hypothetical protein
MTRMRLAKSVLEECSMSLGSMPFRVERDSLI